MHIAPPEQPRDPQRRKLLWVAFWFVFLSTPVLVAALPPVIRQLSVSQLPLMAEVLSYFGSLVAGATMSGFLLARLMNTDTRNFIRQGFGYSVAFAMLHLMVVIAILQFLV